MHDVVKKEIQEGDFFIGSDTLSVKAYNKIQDPESNHLSQDIYFDVPTPKSWSEATNKNYPTAEMVKVEIDERVKTPVGLGAAPTTPGDYTVVATLANDKWSYKWVKVV